MVSIFISLLCVMALHWTNASACPRDQAHRAIYRRNDAADDEWEFFKQAEESAIDLEDLDDFLVHLQSQSDATQKELEDLDNEISSLNHYDHISDIMNDMLKDQSLASKPHTRDEYDDSLDHSDHESIHSYRDNKRRRIIHESVGKDGLKTTGLDHNEVLNDDYHKFDDQEDNFIEMNERIDHDHSESKVKEENRRLIREIAKEFLNDPLDDIKDYDEWLKNVINSPRELKKAYRIKMKAKLILEVYKRKIKDKTGILLKNIQWKHLPEDGFIRWPDQTKNIYSLSLDQLNEILGRIDHLTLSKEFIDTIKQPQKSGSLESKITKYFRDLFQDFITKEKTIPWLMLDHKYLQNWPEGVPVKNPRNLNLDQKKIIHSILDKIKLSDHFKDTYQKRLGHTLSEKKTAISRHFLDKINGHLGLSYGHLPSLRPQDVINWPVLKPVNPFKLSAEEVNYLFENLDSLDIKEECIQELRSKTLKFKKHPALRGIEELRQHLLELINSISDDRKITLVPWNTITRDCLTWWPVDVELKTPFRLSAADLKKIIAHKHRIKLTEKFKARYLTIGKH